MHHTDDTDANSLRITEHIPNRFSNLCRISHVEFVQYVSYSVVHESRGVVMLIAWNYNENKSNDSQLTDQKWARAVMEHRKWIVRDTKPFLRER